jgi:hypothetical protein
MCICCGTFFGQLQAASDQSYESTLDFFAVLHSGGYAKMLKAFCLAGPAGIGIMILGAGLYHHAKHRTAHLRL